MAKRNLVNNYLLVGITEELGEFVAALEAALPRYFLGATDLYNTGMQLMMQNLQIIYIYLYSRISTRLIFFTTALLYKPSLMLTCALQ